MLELKAASITLPATGSALTKCIDPALKGDAHG